MQMWLTHSINSMLFKWILLVKAAYGMYHKTLFLYLNRQYLRLTALVVNWNVEGYLQRLRWRLGQSSWRSFRFCTYLQLAQRTWAGWKPTFLPNVWMRHSGGCLFVHLLHGYSIHFSGNHRTILCRYDSSTSSKTRQKNDTNNGMYIVSFSLDI